MVIYLLVCKVLVNCWSVRLVVIYLLECKVIA